MNILFRVDASKEIGLGHLIRSLTIADALVESKKLDKNNILFACREDQLSKAEIVQHGYQIVKENEGKSEEQFLQDIIEEEKYALLIIDKLYNYKPEFISRIKQFVTVCMMHNLCEGAFHSDVFILPSAHSPEDIIDNVLWEKNKVSFFGGPEYIIINKKILAIKALREKRRENRKKRVVISTGGSDPEAVLLTLLKWVSDLEPGRLEFLALAGKNFAHKRKLINLKKDLPAHIEVKEYDTEAYIHADLAIATFGITTYELLYLGIPTISLGHSPVNSEGSTRLAKRTGSILDLGYFYQLSQNQFIKTLMKAVNDPSLRSKLSEKGNKLVDGKGLTRIVKVILETLNQNHTE